MKYLKIGLLSLIAVTLSKCSSDNESQDTFAEENPLPQLLQQSGFDGEKITYIDDNNAYEIGFGFTPAVNGNIKSLVVKLPKINNDIRVTIWDSETELPILTETVNVTQANQFITKNIAPLSLEQGHGYAITMNTRDYYMWHRQNQGAATWPIMCGNIDITTIHEDIVTDHEFPNFGVINAYFGDCTFIFQQTE